MNATIKIFVLACYSVIVCETKRGALYDGEHIHFPCKANQSVLMEFGECDVIQQPVPIIFSMCVCVFVACKLLTRMYEFTTNSVRLTCIHGHVKYA